MLKSFCLSLYGSSLWPPSIIIDYYVGLELTTFWYCSLLGVDIYYQKYIVFVPCFLTLYIFSVPSPQVSSVPLFRSGWQLVQEPVSPRLAKGQSPVSHQFVLLSSHLSCVFLCLPLFAPILVRVCDNNNTTPTISARSIVRYLAIPAHPSLTTFLVL